MPVISSSRERKEAWGRWLRKEWRVVRKFCVVTCAIVVIDVWSEVCGRPWQKKIIF